MMPLDAKDFIDAGISAGFALLGSVARTLSENLGKDKNATALTVLIVSNGLVAGFCGLLVIPVSKMFHFDPYLTMFMSGMSGWMGGNFLTIMEKIAIEKLGLEKKQND